jgi:UDP-glucose 4-epimerase
MSTSRLAGRTVLVTGADGFIGSHVAERALALGARVRCMCLYNSFGHRGWLDSLPPEIVGALDVRPGDIRDAGFVDAVTTGVDVVLHLAALIAIPYSYIAPRSYIDTNVLGTLNVLEASRRHRVTRVVHTSTSEVYGTPEVLPIRETHPLRGQSPYSASKIAADKLCEAYHDSFDVPVVILRPFNTYGPRQSLRAVLPTILSQLLAGRTTVRLGDLRPRRDLTFVSDTVEGFMLAATTEGLGGDVVQLGTGRAVSVGDLFELAQSILGTKAVVAVDEQRLRPERSEVMALEADPAKALVGLGWKPQVTLEEGIRRTADWCARHLDSSRTDQYLI